MSTPTAGPPAHTLPLGNASRHGGGALRNVRITDLTGQLAGAGATRTLAAFGAQIIRVEDPVRKGTWDIVRQIAPFFPGDRSHEGGAGFNNHNVEKLGITINLRTDRGRELFGELVRISDAVTENFAAGVLAKLGFPYERLKELRGDVVYVSNCGFGHTGPYHPFRTWGPIVQAVAGLSFQAGLPGEEPSGWGFSYMDHNGANIMAIALLAALLHRRRTGEGQWVDLACTEAGASLNGPAMLDGTVNGRPLRREGQPNGNRSVFPAMAPHGVYPAVEDDQWVAITCRNEGEWHALAELIGVGLADAKAREWGTLEGRLADEDALDERVGAYTRARPRDESVAAMRALGITCAAVHRPPERCDSDPNNQAWGLWPTVQHSKHGAVRVDGIPAHFSRTDWRLERGGPLLGEDNERVYSELLGLTTAEIGRLADEGVI